LRGPTIIIVGTVVTLRDKLNWYASLERGSPAEPFKIADSATANWDGSGSAAPR
jgi:hypothetical protein